jgi:dipeptidyl aminopeptidase/acylaminoacyl peptidase
MKQARSGGRAATMMALLGGAALGLAAPLSPALADAPAAPARKAITIDDIVGMQRISDLACAPDGRQAAYVVRTLDAKGDKRDAAIWLTDLGGSGPIQLTRGQDGAGTLPSDDDSTGSLAFSPDGKFISFVAKRGKDEQAQVWLLDRRGGEARRLTEVKGGIDSYRWSPDARRLLITMTDPEPEAPKDDPKRPRPVVVDDVLFKRDETGFITAEAHSHLHVFDIAAGTLTQLTPSGLTDESAAQWSPDGKQVAYLVDHALDPAAPATQWLYVHGAQAGGAPRLIAKLPAAYGQELIWSADGGRITHLVGDAPKVNQYSQPHLAETTVATGQTRILPATAAAYVQRPVDLGGGRIGAILAEDRREFPAVIDPAGGLQRLGDGRLVVAEHCGAKDAKAPRAVIASGDDAMPEVYALEGKTMRTLTAHNSAMSARIAWSEVRDFSATASDGSEVHGMLTLPAGYVPGKRYPTVLWIHGGPTAQDAHEIDANRQLLAAHGYAVLGVNYRGSSGRGDDYAKVIAADWGNKEVLDLYAATDWAVGQGIADPARMGVGGWSYGGVLTDFLIVRDNRFKAAFSGAGEGNIFALFGVDQYIQQYAQEVGAPWENLDLWLKLSEPLLRADRIKTPTLFMGGIADDNMPLIGGQQLYQALKLTGVPTQLVGYPDQFHGLTRPSFERDRLERMVDWFGRYLKP